MISGDLAQHIEALVDHLRKNKAGNMSLLDVASVTEVLIATTTAYFKSIDTTIYRECRNLSDYIQNARSEIAAMQPGDLESDRIPRAGLELDAIVQHTESATNTIMEAAEEIMGLDPNDKDDYVIKSQDAVMRIFEACSFQDITGQRISKVVQTLAHIEERVADLRTLLGVSEDDLVDAQAKQEEKAQENPSDNSLLSGPALSGEGIDQSEVDDLMVDTQPAPAPAPAEAAAPAPVEAPAPAPSPAEATAPAPAPEPAKAPTPAPAEAAAPAPAPAPPVPPPPPPAPPPKPVNPQVLDNMFEEDFDPMDEVTKKKVKDPEPEKKKPTEQKKAAEKEVSTEDLGEEVSQDDIDALFG